MTVRRITSILFASVLFTGGLAAVAHAAPATHPVKHAMPHHAPVMHHAAPKAHHSATPAAMRRGPAAVRGGDAQNGAVDQLNDQSLSRARTGAPAQ